MANFIDQFGVEYSEDKKTLISCPQDLEGEYVILDGCESIDYSAFRCPKLTAITIPASLSTIDDSTFDHCEHLSTITIYSQDLVGRNYEGDVDWPSNEKNIISFFQHATKVIIGEGVTYLGENVFYGCDQLKSVVLPSTLETIGVSAFEGCTSLEELIIPEGVKRIKDRAFYRCTGLTTLALPKGIEVFGSNACYLVNNVSYDDDEYSYNSMGAKSHNGYIDGPLVYSSEKKTCLLGCNGLAVGDIHLPDSVREIGEHAFEGCNQITSVHIPDSVSRIGNCAFRGCSSITTMAIPQTIERFDDVECNHVIYGGWEIQCQSAKFSIKAAPIDGCMCAQLYGEFDGEYRVYIPSAVKTIDMNNLYYRDGREVCFYRFDDRKIFVPSSVSQIVCGQLSESTIFYIDNLIENVEIIGADKRRDRRFIFRAPVPNHKVDGKTVELTMANNNVYYRSNGLWSAPITIHSDFVAYVTPEYMKSYGEPEHEGCRILLLGRGGELVSKEHAYPYVDVWESYQSVLDSLHRVGWHK